MFLKGHWKTDTFVTNYLPFILFPILYIGAKIYFRTPLVKYEDMDFVTGLKEIEADTYDEPPPRNWVERIWGWLVSGCLTCPLVDILDAHDLFLPLVCRCKTTSGDRAML